MARRFSGRRSRRYRRKTRRTRKAGVVRVRGSTFSRRVSRAAFSGRYPGNRDSITVRLEQRFTDFQLPLTATATSGGFNFTLSNLGAAGINDYINQYSFYRINWIAYKLTPNAQNTLPVTSGYPTRPDFIIAPDRTISLPTVTLAEALSWPNRKVVPITGQTTTLIWRPSTLQYGYGSGVTTPTYTLTGPQWIPTSDTQFPHMGLKYYAVNPTQSAPTFNPSYSFNTHVRMSVTFKEKD